MQTPMPTIGKLALVVVLASAACSDGSGETRIPEPPGNAPQRDRRLSSRELDASGMLAAPTDLALVGRYLVLLNTRGDSAIHVYDTQTDKLVRSFGREGGGPGEFRGAWSLDPEPGSRSAFWVFDIGLQRFARIDLDRDFAPGARYGTRIVQMQGSAPVLSPVWVGDSLLVSPGVFAEGGRLAWFASTGRMRSVVGDDPPGRADVPMQVRQHAYQSTVRPNPQRTLLAAGTRHADRLEILRVDGSRVAAAARPANFEPVYKTTLRAGQPTMDSGDEMRFGYIDLATTSDRIYALYSGRKRADFPGQANYGEYVHVYDWNAKLIEVIGLDSPAITIEADEAQQKLYAVRHNPTPALLVYDLRTGTSGSAERSR